VPVAGWTRFSAAQEWVDRNTPAASAATAGVLKSNASSPQEDPALYREFLEWKATHANNRRH
jgi:hypothetical protein